MREQLIEQEDVTWMESRCMKDGLLQVMPYSWYLFNASRSQQLNFMFKHGFYCLPTVELVDLIRSKMSPPAIEIGAGNGCLGRALGIPLTDSKMQDDPDIIREYAHVKQPTVIYPDDIEKLTAIQAVRKYKPQTVVGAFVTQKWHPGMTYGNERGVDFETLYKEVRRVILVGNRSVHGPSTFMSKKHTEIYEPFILTRAIYPEQNRLYIWVH